MIKVWEKLIEQENSHENQLSDKTLRKHAIDWAKNLWKKNIFREKLIERQILRK